MRAFTRLIRKPAFQAYALIWMALALRLWYASGQLYAPLKLVGDEGSYYGGAVQLARGIADLLTSDSWLRWHDFWLQPPLYTLSLVAPIKLLGEGLPALRLLQTMAGVLTVALLYRLGRKLFGRRVGLWTGLLAALYFPLVSLPVQLMTENLYYPLLVLAFVLLVEFRQQGDWLRAGAAGLVLGLATLTRTVTTLFIPVAAVWLLLSFSPHTSRKRLAAQVGLFALGVAVVIGPWTLRNYALYHRVLLTDTKGAAVMTEVDPAILTRLDKTANPVDYQSQVIREFVKDWQANPTASLSRFPLHALHLLRLEGLKTFSQMDFGYSLSEFARDFALDDAIVLVTLLFGFSGLAAARDWKVSLLFLGWLGYNLVILTLVYYSAIRYRHPVVILLMPYAAFGLTRLRATFSTRLRPMQLAAWGLGALVLIGALGEYPGKFAELVAAMQAINRAELARQAGDAAGVTNALAQARAAAPSSAAVPIAAGDLTRRMGQTAQAVQYYRMAERLLPASYSIQLRLGDLLRATGQADQAVTTLSPPNQDDSDFLNWAWEHPEAVSRRSNVLDVGLLDAGLVHWVYYPGLVDSEQANWPMRWTQRVSEFRLYAAPGHARALGMFLAAARPQDVPRPQVAVSINGRPVGQFLARRVWGVVNLALPADLASAGEYVVTLRTDAWIPIGKDLRLPDPEMPDLGVQLSRIQIGDEPLTVDYLLKQ